MKSLYTSCLFFSLLFVGCAYQENLEHFNKLYYEENQQKAFEFSKKRASNDLLWQIQSGVSGYTIQNYKESMSILDTAENLLNEKQAKGLVSNLVSNTGATLINDNIKSYEGSIYEGVLINYYKALDALAMDDSSRARIEFNRANDRQRRAKDYYEKEIKKALEEQHKNAEQKDNKTSEQIDQNTSSQKIDSILNTQYSNLKNFKIYSGFINPLVSYISGLYFSLQGDSKGIDLLKEAYGINHSNIIAEDILLFQNHKYNKNKYTWIVIEDGKSATKKEFSLNLPLYLINSEVLYFGIALPQLEEGVDFYHSFALDTKHSSKNFEEISLFDGVIANEFSKQLPFIITRAIISAVYKASMQGVLKETIGGFAALGGAIFSLATTAADTRITTVFPHKVWLNRIQNNQKSAVLEADGKKILEIELANCNTKKPSSPKPEENATLPIHDEYKICNNTNNIIYIRTTKNNIITKLILGEKQ